MHLDLKSLGKYLLRQFALLFFIVGVAVFITGIPTDFDLVYQEGRYLPNMGWDQIWGGVRGNFLFFFGAQAPQVNVLGERLDTLFMESAAKSFTVLFPGALLALLLGIPKGIVDSRKGDITGTFKMLQSLIPLSVPDILTIGLVQMGALYLFRNNLTFLGLGPIEFHGDSSWLHAIFPVLSISLLPAAYIARITANALEEGFAKPYILAARGKGCSRWRIIRTHMLKIILYEVLSSFPTVLTLMFSSLIIVESMFYYRGIGYYLIFFYTTFRIPAEDAGLAFTYFIIWMTAIYFIIFQLFTFLKEVLLPQLKGK